MRGGVPWPFRPRWNCFPPKCIICQKILTGRETICPECARSLPVATGTQIKHKLEFTEGCYAPFFYEEPLRSAFLRYKFSGRGALCRHFRQVDGGLPDRAGADEV